MVLILRCSCGWETKQESNDHGGIFLEELKKIHLMTFPDHECKIVGGNPAAKEL